MKKWVKLIKADFMYGVSEPWCDDQGVAILPFIYQYNQYWFLLIHEANPLLKGRLHQSYGTLTGGCELKLDLLTTVKNELYEETGINVKKNEDVIFHDLGSYYANKTNIKIWHLYAVDLTSLNLNLQETYHGKGDGSAGEKNINGVFVNEVDLDKTNDSLALAIYGKLKLEKILNNPNLIV
ncbi:hypothetical protein [Spiroplasma platyhelix]|uniref:Nudix hydrolase domain-containing protein n=1 Tax=Spiroplasma platyhelix PALS-1 TaxID=1276218 RepID=A0A846UC99_9MOLU|nr:hypothetical protein [Spiroplasma platyhelix]MBE4703785.1 hypothetical protein [Spiroplasma platyhelix PALS-1]NKE38158.1 hypothetical protein [Spiroplasma platyhelix PALS-1]UJB29043.1 hypothetical protein SPLAT_v1c02790 [Spiroplasma platyhelix PALS-1]